MGKHSANKKNPFDRKRSAGRAAEHSRKGIRSLGGPTARTRPHPLGDEQYRLSDPNTKRTASLEKAPARLRAERERRNRKYKRAALAVLAVVALVFVAGGIAAWAWVSTLQNTMVVKAEKLAPSLEKAKPQEPYTVLLLGGDKRRDEPYRTDTMILAKVDPKKKKMWMLSIPRDTRVEIAGHGAVKINSAFTYGGEEGAIKAVKQLTGVPINHYMHVDFKGFKKAVDALGGVWIDVPVVIDDRQAASHNRSASHIDAGYQLLDGDHALTFVRARHQFADQDFSRMKNQQIFFKALADQVAKSQNLTKVPRVVSSVAPYIKTDMSLMEMIRTAQAMRGAGSKKMYTATLEGEWRTPFIYIDEVKKAELIEKMKKGRSFDGSETPDAEDSKVEASAVSAKEPGDITVTVRNGGGIAGCASQASSIVKARGFDVQEVGNASRFVYDKTLVVFKTDQANAAQVAAALPPGAKLVESRGMYSFDTDVLVVIGKDWDLARVPVEPINTN
ncbi:MAG TPA: LCP family protein [Coriobacteriia bacterium]|nr:LCP family protein [Coriobacteriia bacterium]